MKIQKIKVSAFRGIPNDFERELNCKSMVIEGDNGTGKSGLIDAVDFLFTGKIKRLSGEGTRNIPQENYGHHIDKNKEDATVEAKIQFEGKDLVIKRKLSQQTKLIKLEGEQSVFDNLKVFLEAGQFSLSRRELLKFIICTDQDRSRAIQELLDISEIEKIRMSIDHSYESQKKANDKLKNQIENENSDLKKDLELDSSDTNVIRNKINEYREELKTEKITIWDQNTDILKDIQFEKISSNLSLTKTKFNRSIEFLKQENKSLIEEKNKIFEIISKIIQIESFEKLTKTNDLVDLGMKLLTDNNCPLCDTEWKEKDLMGYLQSKLKQAKEAILLKRDFETISEKIISFLKTYISSFQNILVEVKKSSKESVTLEKKLETSIKFIENHINLYKNIFKPKELLSTIKKEVNIIDLPNWNSLNIEIHKFLQELPEESKEQNIYNALTSVKTRKENVQRYEKERQLNENKFNLIKNIKDHFEKRKDSFFKNLYKEIENDFINYYRFLNEDEVNFSAELKDKKGSTDLKVDFYGRGTHPPNALHSEGHQDSMGICLFLALMKKIKANDFSIALLDDVMMSVDIGHRRKLAQLLKDQFSETQFLITTHDSIWAKELKNLDIVSKDNMLKFLNWSPAGGPSYRLSDPWTQCENYIKQGEIEFAGKVLRETLEEEFQGFCENLKGMVPFKNDANWGLGDLMNGALQSFNKYIKKAKNIAESNNNEIDLKKIEEIENTFKTAQTEAEIDQWIINPMNHYNEKAKFSKEEGKNIIQKMKKFCEAFSYNGDHFIISLDRSHNLLAFTTSHSKISFSLKKE